MFNKNIRDNSEYYRHTVKHPNIPCAIRSFPHSPQLPIPVPPKTWKLGKETADVESCAESCGDVEKEGTDFFESRNTGPRIISKSELNHLVSDLYLSKNQALLLTSRLKTWNPLQCNIKISSFRDRQCDFECFFLQYENLVYYNDVESLLDFRLICHPDA